MPMVVEDKPVLVRRAANRAIVSAVVTRCDLGSATEDPERRTIDEPPDRTSVVSNGRDKRLRSATAPLMADLD
jgi:hypothetical protein